MWALYDDDDNTDTVDFLLRKGANLEAKSKVRIPQHRTRFHWMSF
jgi:hypothetical protein